MIAYGSLGDAKQYVSAYVEGTAPDVRRYPVSITVTAGIQVDVAYPAEAWMTAEDVADYFNGTLKPDLEASLTNLINNHNQDPNAHNGALKGKQDAIKVEGLLKGTKTTAKEGETYSVGAAAPGTDYQAPTNTLEAAEAMSAQDYIPFFDHKTSQHKRATLQALKEAIGVQSPAIRVTTCAGASVTCSDGATTLEGTGSTEFELPNVGNWTVTATLDGASASHPTSPIALANGVNDKITVELADSHNAPLAEKIGRDICGEFGNINLSCIVKKRIRCVDFGSA